MNRAKATAGLVAWGLFLVVATAGLARLPLPAVHGDPVLLAVAGLRLVAIGTGLYLLTVLAVGTVARATRLTALVRMTDAEVVPYWRSVIDRNAATFVRAGDPNLVFAGQALDLPPPPPSPP